MPLIGKTLMSIALLWGAVEIIPRLWTRAERRHYGHRSRMKAEKVASGVTGAFVLVILLISVWTQ